MLTAKKATMNSNPKSRPLAKVIKFTSHLAKKRAASTDREIITTYYFRNKVVKIIRSRFAFNAVPNCMKHMQTNEYGATHAEVYDSRTSEVHAVIKRSIGSNEIKTLLERKPEQGV